MDGLDALQRQVRRAEQAFRELDGELAAVRIDFRDPGSVDAALTEIDAAIDAKAAPYAGNPFVDALVEQLKKGYRADMSERVDLAQIKASSEGTVDMDQTIFRTIENVISDLRTADSRGFHRHIGKLSRILNEPPLKEITDTLKQKVDLAAWLARGEATQGGMVGSAMLSWPEDAEEELGIILALTDAFSDGTVDVTSFTYTFFYKVNNITTNIQALVSQVYVPFARDFINHVKDRTGAKEVAFMPKAGASPLSRKVFVVHGHDEAPKLAVARFLERLGFEAIILHEQASRGMTIIEKIEEHGDVGFAVILFTPDDLGGAVSEQPRPRARQNVVLELGYFLGRLGRSRVLALKKGNIEIPSDFGGVVFEPYDNGTGWHQRLGKELQAAGFDIDWNTVMR